MKLTKLALAALISLSPLTLFTSEAKALNRVQISPQTNCNDKIWYQGGNDFLLSLRGGQILTVNSWESDGLSGFQFKDSKGRLIKPIRQIKAKYDFIKEAQYNIPYDDNYTIRLYYPSNGIPARFCVSSQSSSTRNNNQSFQANTYNLNRIPSGYWTYYERNFRTQVIYFRTGNTMTGRMGNICFAAQIYPSTVTVNWWGQVPSTLRNNYSVADFTADNVNFQPTNSRYYQQIMNYCR